MSLTPIVRIERLLEMESRTPQKDDAGVYIPNGMDSAIRQKAYQECLNILKSNEVIDDLR